MSGNLQSLHNLKNIIIPAARFFSLELVLPLLLCRNAFIRVDCSFLVSSKHKTFSEGRYNNSFK